MKKKKIKNFIIISILIAKIILLNVCINNKRIKCKIEKKKLVFWLL